MWVRVMQILSKDSVTVAVDAVVYYRVSNATVSVTNVEDAHRSTRLLAQTTLRNVLGTKNLSEILSDRENISHFMQVLATRPTCSAAWWRARYGVGLAVAGSNSGNDCGQVVHTHVPLLGRLRVHAGLLCRSSQHVCDKTTIKQNKTNQFVFCIFIFAL